jgi:hypothetical protein
MASIEAQKNKKTTDIFKNIRVLGKEKALVLKTWRFWTPLNQVELI